MGISRRSATSRPRAKKATRPASAAKKPPAKSLPAKAAQAKAAVAKATPAKLAQAKSAPAKLAQAKAAPAKPAQKGAAARPSLPQKSAARGAARPALHAKGGNKPGQHPKLKTVQRVAPVVHPIGVLPPDAVSRAPQKPARPVAMPPRPVAKAVRPSSPDAGAQPVTHKDFPEFEQRLLEERVRVLKEMGHYENTVLKVNPRDSAGDLSGYSFHMADVGTDAMEREKAFQLASAEGRILLEINEALRRIARGEYGICESCENPIFRPRLEAMPTARLCLSCKEKEERAARGTS